MTHKDVVTAREPRARCVQIPVKGQPCNTVDHYEVKVGLNANPPTIGLGRTADEAWEDAATRLGAGRGEQVTADLCMRKLYDQDDGEVTHCQLPKGHKGKHTPWPELNIQKPEQHFPVGPDRGGER